MNEPIYNEYSKKDIIPILQTALEDGIISADSVLDTIMATKRQQISNMHPYAITPPKADGGRWQTRYRDADGTIRISKHRPKMNCWISWYHSTYPTSTLTISHSMDCMKNGSTTKRTLPVVQTPSSDTDSITGSILRTLYYIR